MSFGPGGFYADGGRRRVMHMGDPSMRDGKGISKEKYKKLKLRLKMLEQKVEAMWDAPGMPGANAIVDEFMDGSQN